MQLSVSPCHSPYPVSIRYFKILGNPFVLSAPQMPEKFFIFVRSYCVMKMPVYHKEIS